MLLSHERSVKKEDMNHAELDFFLRQVTPRERFYLDNPGAVSPRYKTMEQRLIHGREVYYFHLQELPSDEIHLRKDSRFTDVPYYMHSNVNINYIYSGHCDYLIDDKPITLYKGDVCIFDIDVVRRKLLLGADDIVINLNMTQEFFRDSFFHKAGQQNVFSDFMIHVLSTSNTVHDHYLIFRTGGNPEIAHLFEQLMVKQYPELERGESASQTGREHIPPCIFKEMTQLTKQKEQLDALLVGITPFNGKSRAAEISKVLDSYIPNVARMKDQLRKYNVAFTKTAAENEKLKEKNKTLSASLDKAKEGSVLKRLEDAKLRQDYEAALKTLDSIPPEVIRFYENRTQEPAMRHDK